MGRVLGKLHKSASIIPEKLHEHFQALADHFVESLGRRIDKPRREIGQQLLESKSLVACQTRALVLRNVADDMNRARNIPFLIKHRIGGHGPSELDDVVIHRRIVNDVYSGLLAH